MPDVSGALVEFLRTTPALDGLIDTFTLPGLTGRAVFRTEAPEKYRFGLLPAIIVDPVQEGPRSLGSFSSRTPMLDVQVRIFAQAPEGDDAALSATAWKVSDALLDAALSIEGAVLNDIDCGPPEDTPTSGPSIGGRRLLVRTLITPD